MTYQALSGHNLIGITELGELSKLQRKLGKLIARDWRLRKKFGRTREEVLVSKSKV